MTKQRIDNIIEEIKHRTVWGICLDVIELNSIKKDAEHIISLVDDALLDVEHFVKNNTVDPKTPEDEEE